MSTEYLTEATIFQCSLCSATIIYCEEPTNDTVKYRGSKILTRKARLKSAKGTPCPVLTTEAQGTLQPCKCSFWRSWIKFSRTKKAKGANLLTKSSKIYCSHGGLITAKINRMNKNLVQEFAPYISKIEWLDNVAEITASTQAINKHSSSRLNVNEEQSTALENVDKFADDINEVKVDEVEQAKIAKVKPICGAVNMAASLWQKCASCKECKYPTASLAVNNDSLILRKNYEQMDLADKDDFDKYYDEIKDQDNAWTYQFHHIISGNQVLKNNQDIVKLANFYGYDINSAANCIPLISNLRDGKFGSKTDARKSISAYDAMSESGIQWHVGGHAYNFDGEDIQSLRQRIKLYTKREVKGPILNYAQLLSAELNKMKLSLKQTPKCYNTPQLRAGFITRMNNLSKKVKAKLAAFKEAPHHSYPYYVSKEAYLFSFSLPRTAKIIFIEQNEEEFSLQKYRAERFDETIKQQGENLKFVFKDSMKCNSFDTITKQKIIAFCENVEYFIVRPADIRNSELAFLFNNCPQPLALRGKKAIEEYDTEILVWLRDNPREYISPVRKIKERLTYLNEEN